MCLAISILTSGKRRWYMDGTFDYAPLVPAAICHSCPLGDSAVSCVYAFLPNKTQTTLKNFSALSRHHIYVMKKTYVAIFAFLLLFSIYIYIYIYILLIW